MSSTYEDSAVGERLSEIRSDERLTQQQFANALGLPLRTYQNYERGERPITKDLIIALISKYRVHPAWLLLGEGEKKGKTSEKPNCLINLQVLMLVGSALKHAAEEDEKMKRYSSSLNMIGHIYNNVAQRMSVELINAARLGDKLLTDLIYEEIDLLREGVNPESD